VSWSKDAAEAPRRVLEEFLGKYQFVSRGSSAMCDRPRVTVGQPEVYIVAEQAKILVDEAEENNLDTKAFNARWWRWFTCSLCEQNYHGVVACALRWRAPGRRGV